MKRYEQQSPSDQVMEPVQKERRIFKMVGRDQRAREKMNSREQLLSRITSEIERYVDEEVERRTKKTIENENAYELPEILTAEDISKYLSISRRRVYELFELNVENRGIPNFKIGNSRRVDRRDLYKWIEDRKREQKGQFQK